MAVAPSVSSPLFPMKAASLTRLLITTAFVLGLQTAALAHAGHGDEFEATGGVLPVAVNTSVDRQLGIQVTFIEQALDASENASENGNARIMIPVSAIVEVDGKQWVFVQYENFYEPVEITTGMSEGDRIEVTQNLSVGEQLVTQGGLMLYAQSRKTAADHHHHDDHSHPRLSRKRLAAGGVLLFGIAGIGVATLGRKSKGDAQ